MVNIYDEMNRKTKENIRMCFLQLLQEKDFMKISIQDITSAAKINRGTFYLHYLDKYDLMNQMEETLISGLEAQLKSLEPDQAILEDAEKGVPSIHAIAVFHYIKQNADQFRIFLGEHGLSDFHKRLKHFFQNHFIEHTLGNEELFRNLTISSDYLSAFATSAFLGLIEQWLENNLAETPTQMAEMYMKIILFIKNL